MSSSSIEKKTKLSKRLRDSYKNLEDKSYDLIEALDFFVNSYNKAKFVETLEVVLNLGVDPKQSDQMVRGMTQLPNGTGKDIKVAVFVPDEMIAEAQAAGADIAGNQNLVEKIKKGQIDFHRCIAVPQMMPLVSQVAKDLGPKGLMPNPKLGTVTPNFVAAIKAAKAGEVEFRVDKNGIIHVGVGNLSFEKQALL